MNVFIQITESCQEVCKYAENVHINYNAIDELLENGIQKGKYWGEPKWTIVTDNGELYDGSTALMCIFVSNIDLFSNFKKVENMTFDEFKDFMKGNVEIPLIHERYEILVNISKIVNEKMNGNFYQYTKNIVRDINLINILIDNFPTFKDIRTYKGKKVYFYKLASLLTSDILHARKIKEGIEVDYSNIAGCSDYKIPQIIRDLNIIEYSSQLGELVDSKTPIMENNPMEVEIRASVIEVERYIVDKTNECGIEVNDYLWLKSKTNKNDRPYHLTRTINY